MFGSRSSIAPSLRDVTLINYSTTGALLEGNVNLT